MRDKNSQLSMLNSIGADYFNEEPFCNCMKTIDDLLEIDMPEGRFVNDYLFWGYESLTYIKTYLPSEYENANKIFHNLPIKHHRRIWIIIYTSEYYPEENSRNNKEQPLLNINNIQNNINQNFFQEQIKNFLSEEEYAEIKKIIDEHKNNPVVLKSTVIEKIKSFSSDVVSNILANLLSNPNIYNLL